MKSATSRSSKRPHRPIADHVAWMICAVGLLAYITAAIFAIL